MACHGILQLVWLLRILGLSSHFGRDLGAAKGRGSIVQRTELCSSNSQDSTLCTGLLFTCSGDHSLPKLLVAAYAWYAEGAKFNPQHLQLNSLMRKSAALARLTRLVQKNKQTNKKNKTQTPKPKVIFELVYDRHM